MDAEWNDDTDYEEPTQSADTVCDPIFQQMLRAVNSGSLEKRRIEEICNSLETYEPVWIVRNQSPSETLQQLLENTGFLNGNVTVPKASEISERCNGLRNIERIMYEHTVWLRQSVFCNISCCQIIASRCEAVLYAVQFARKGIILLSKSIAHSSGDIIYQLPDLPLEFPLHLNDALILEAKTMFNSFIESIGNRCNGKRNAWELKSKAVKDLEIFLRTKLAVESSSFLFFDRENLRLSECRVWWKKSDVSNFETLPWKYLLQGFSDGGGCKKYLGVIPKKDNQQFSQLLKTLVVKKLY